MRLSARNQLSGTVKAIKTGMVTGMVTVDVGGNEVVAVITMDAIEEMGLKEGDQATVVIKATEVMLMK
jgi:molybdate transport system regulatory protein